MGREQEGPQAPCRAQEEKAGAEGQGDVSAREDTDLGNALRRAAVAAEDPGGTEAPHTCH